MKTNSSGKYNLPKRRVSLCFVVEPSSLPFCLSFKAVESIRPGLMGLVDSEPAPPPPLATPIPTRFVIC